jgi:hypothetical protein
MLERATNERFYARKGALKQLRSKAWWECRMLTELSASLQAKLLKHQEKRLILIHSTHTAGR